MMVACSFQPLLSGSQALAHKQMFHVSVKGKGAVAYRFRRAIERSLAIVPKIMGEPIRVHVRVTEDSAPLTYESNATISQQQNTVRAVYHVVTSQGECSAEDSIHLSYPVFNSDPFVTQTTQDAISQREARLLAERVALDIVRLSRTLMRGEADDL